MVVSLAGGAPTHPNGCSRSMLRVLVCLCLCVVCVCDGFTVSGNRVQYDTVYMDMEALTEGTDATVPYLLYRTAAPALRGSTVDLGADTVAGPYFSAGAIEEEEGSFSLPLYAHASWLSEAGVYVGTLPVSSLTSTPLILAGDVSEDPPVAAVSVCEAEGIEGVDGMQCLDGSAVLLLADLRDGVADAERGLSGMAYQSNSCSAEVAMLDPLTEHTQIVAFTPCGPTCGTAGFLFIVDGTLEDASLYSAATYPDVAPHAIFSFVSVDSSSESTPQGLAWQRSSALGCVDVTEADSVPLRVYDTTLSLDSAGTGVFPSLMVQSLVATAAGGTVGDVSVSRHSYTTYDAQSEGEYYTTTVQDLPLAGGLFESEARDDRYSELHLTRSVTNSAATEYTWFLTCDTDPDTSDPTLRAVPFLTSDLATPAAPALSLPDVSGVCDGYTLYMWTSLVTVAAGVDTSSGSNIPYLILRVGDGTGLASAASSPVYLSSSSVYSALLGLSEDDSTVFSMPLEADDAITLQSASFGGFCTLTAGSTLWALVYDTTASEATDYTVAVNTYSPSLLVSRDALDVSFYPSVTVVEQGTYSQHSAVIIQMVGSINLLDDSAVSVTLTVGDSDVSQAVTNTEYSSTYPWSLDVVSVPAANTLPVAVLVSVQVAESLTSDSLSVTVPSSVWTVVDSDEALNPYSLPLRLDTAIIDLYTIPDSGVDVTTLSASVTLYGWCGVIDTASDLSLTLLVEGEYSIADSLDAPYSSVVFGTDPSAHTSCYSGSMLTVLTVECPTDTVCASSGYSTTYPVPVLGSVVAVSDIEVDSATAGADAASPNVRVTPILSVEGPDSVFYSMGVPVLPSSSVHATVPLVDETADVYTLTDGDAAQYIQYTGDLGDTPSFTSCTFTAVYDTLEYTSEPVGLAGDQAIAMYIGSSVEDTEAQNINPSSTYAATAVALTSDPVVEALSVALSDDSAIDIAVGEDSGSGSENANVCHTSSSYALSMPDFSNYYPVVPELAPQYIPSPFVADISLPKALVDMEEVLPETLTFSLSGYPQDPLVLTDTGFTDSLYTYAADTTALGTLLGVLESVQCGRVYDAALTTDSLSLDPPLVLPLTVTEAALPSNALTDPVFTHNLPSLLPPATLLDISLSGVYTADGDDKDQTLCCSAISLHVSTSTSESLFSEDAVTSSLTFVDGVPFQQCVMQVDTSQFPVFSEAIFEYDTGVTTYLTTAISLLVSVPSLKYYMMATAALSVLVFCTQTTSYCCSCCCSCRKTRRKAGRPRGNRRVSMAAVSMCGRCCGWMGITISMLFFVVFIFGVKMLVLGGDFFVFQRLFSHLRVRETPDLLYELPLVSYSFEFARQLDAFFDNVQYTLLQSEQINLYLSLGVVPVILALLLLFKVILLLVKAQDRWNGNLFVLLCILFLLRLLTEASELCATFVSDLILWVMSGGTEGLGDVPAALPICLFIALGLPLVSLLAMATHEKLPFRSLLGLKEGESYWRAPHLMASFNWLAEQFADMRDYNPCDCGGGTELGESLMEWATDTLPRKIGSILMFSVWVWLSPVVWGGCIYFYYDFVSNTNWDGIPYVWEFVLGLAALAVVMYIGSYIAGLPNEAQRRHLRENPHLKWKSPWRKALKAAAITLCLPGWLCVVFLVFSVLVLVMVTAVLGSIPLMIMGPVILFFVGLAIYLIWLGICLIIGQILISAAFLWVFCSLVGFCLLPAGTVLHTIIPTVSLMLGIVPRKLRNRVVAILTQLVLNLGVLATIVYFAYLEVLRIIELGEIDIATPFIVLCFLALIVLVDTIYTMIGRRPSMNEHFFDHFMQATKDRKKADSKSERIVEYTMLVKNSALLLVPLVGPSAVTCSDYLTSPPLYVPGLRHLSRANYLTNCIGLGCLVFVAQAGGLTTPAEYIVYAVYTYIAMQLFDAWNEAREAHREYRLRLPLMSSFWWAMDRVFSHPLAHEEAQAQGMRQPVKAVPLLMLSTLDDTTLPYLTV
ncbi:hypothetical protein KIPB_000320 [Kipferlia bialata]|uniref:Uncharacterized protein n=1 Tax=Kipferlia bialata TaxID=797122 RepID=A0A9K3GEA2_9EUKA|nr:hypothetical protein KIPB_000320 [Kipferlia bialata]|eukprot:g320.t1